MILHVLFPLYFLFICASLYVITVTLNSTIFFYPSSTLNSTIFYKEDLPQPENDLLSSDIFPVWRNGSSDDLPPAENVLLATGYRTGGSFFGELFNQNDDVFYVSLS